MIHIVKNPFFCREGQFGEGRKLVIGIAVDALVKDIYQFRIGKNPQLYQGETVMIKQEGYLWKNREGKSVYIIPVENFEKIKEN